MVQAVKLKRLGCRAGTFDLMIFEPRPPFHGLFVEMKRPAIKDVCSKGSVSPEQKTFANEAINRGYSAIICYGAEEAIREIEGYLVVQLG